MKVTGSSTEAAFMEAVEVPMKVRSFYYLPRKRIHSPMKEAFVEVMCTWAVPSAQVENPVSRQRGVLRGPRRAPSGTTLKSMTARVCAYG